MPGREALPAFPWGGAPDWVITGTSGQLIQAEGSGITVVGALSLHTVGSPCLRRCGLRACWIVAASDWPRPLAVLAVLAVRGWGPAALQPLPAQVHSMLI